MFWNRHQRTGISVACAIAVAVAMSEPGIMFCQDEAPQTQVASSDPNLPQALTDEHFHEFLENSPFTRAINLSESLMLTGIASFGGKPVATLMDRESKETYVISEVPNPQGWKLVEISSPTGANLETVSAMISVGGEMVTVRYDERQLKPGEGKPAAGKLAKDDRPPPTEEEKKKYGLMIRNKWNQLDKAQQEQAKKIMGEKMKANPKLSDRQRGEMINGIVDYVRSDKARTQREGGGKR